MGIKSQILQAIESMFGKDATPTLVQQKAIPLGLKGKNIIAQSKTGTGKTLAYLIPIVEKLEFLKQPEALILVPTRELCKQVDEVLQNLNKFVQKIRSVQIYGGVSIENQINKIKRGVNIIVATPGRLIDIYERGKINFNSLRFVVLDEADRMLDMGFFPDIQFIFSKIKTNPQYFLFSATILEEIKELSMNFTKGNYIDLDISKDKLTVENTQQYYYLIKDFRDKFYYFTKLLFFERPKKALIFTNTKKTADWLKNKLDSMKSFNRKIGLLSGNMSQFAREKEIKRFKNNEIDILIATDVAARGLDIAEVTHVINYDVPQFEENYVHRIGRTSRMGKKGKAITLVLMDEYQYLCRIEGFIKKSIKKRELKELLRDNRNRYKGKRGNIKQKEDSAKHKNEFFINPFK